MLIIKLNSKYFIIIFFYNIDSFYEKWNFNCDILIYIWRFEIYYYWECIVYVKTYANVIIVYEIMA